ncbi:hypothetical protein [Psychroserpens sp.]|uniref:hypothetical protein n=1 Tax=Psychroserpens sp. TaxID=2020870 RepID=UPI001B15D381|nr:hypothetical protein [Psychroserpens sp.]MBO6607190.1 hypothetical protein [Psychroserpens sp.]MBO6631294.1 hypothetical protein [Psychroserpens sp.]MBO6654336.1 hypothetical protein [Psychroserpens sp.]MBO6682378.1 hypothetical protein [Psychroserpens sp.]MBO6750962.1 hypothetical protein [Psychroserpens sp.]
MRVKFCDICNKDFDTMYRIQYKLPKQWVFVCEDCLLQVKPRNKNYKYGGTWKR